MSPKAILVLLLSGCASGASEQLALAPTTPIPAEPPPLAEPAPAPAAAAPAPVARAPVASDSAPAPAPAPSPSPPAADASSVEKPPGAVWPPPEGWDPPPCEVETSTTLRARGAAYEVTASLKNRSKKPLEFDLPDRCPQGLAYFHGLSEVYDYYDTCAAGACVAHRSPVHFRIEPGQTVTVATIRINPKGNACNPPLEPGVYTFSFEVSTGHVVCAGPAAEFERRAAAQKPSASTPERP